MCIFFGSEFDSMPLIRIDSVTPEFRVMGVVIYIHNLII